ncbi:pyruvate dehydrogenase (acetyl-transferring), homodimeric type [bacterium (Candidatus Blackallbacteria) CG17_big_fil_post_rev_8_21_14_2_50_48_46]|uniref:Pyruvate dehydrogenase E1 component n=1 Tax=bacterium (Candidatus Blackallbacteria) CG17_big_fil_post_rev_8_21_14_2_50_48_46 TaxID=2014261 RepID=A0A2M7G4Y7_9BACT|nr:MAG: pyruvate dehydrogenase (acetyl-transferring), homodimeric type [bacterium (Candidatus Blackallbacteria) CG18_big_fil_WC_8_21_14_2_50_49_26]PIW17003.1 MAG: pyruvate dehydrogenase (acetyl-transferring), homodimeric type [bacterium (Candidatus Blackallbacteria) CG17_big_fil_post_rev_8_21_14_2_50_48_46]PIW48189.1 MAG: pyruvate dehydrogenase (acetyl-transferring), homodimeric type [bacterium (Candidatus Blackallbacteria) CG13_big_fil_rev_8_21_14_2_50_49_14]
MTEAHEDAHAIEEIETREWLESLDYVIQDGGSERTRRLFVRLQNRAAKFGVDLPYSTTTPYVNTIPRHQQPPYPGRYEIERRIKSIMRWNAMAMVVRANRDEDGIGGHLSSFASSATLYEVGFNHFFQGKHGEKAADQIYFQGHAAPGIYARAFLEGRLSEEQLSNYRRELQTGGGLSSYPHPWLMPDFWEFPTVSMGLGPLMSIYQARFNKYLENRGLKKQTGKVWAFLGDGEMDEPESLGAISLAGREQLDNLVFVINCNLQRLDGPVRGNGKIVQELEGVFRGAGWNVLKVLWGSDWDTLLEKDKTGLLVQRMNETLDGEYQKIKASGSGAYVREHFFGKYPELLELVEDYTDDQLWNLHRGGHDSLKVYAAYHQAVHTQGMPTVILAKTIKGYGLGDSGQGKNVAHQQKKLTEDEIREFRSRFGIPIADEDLLSVPFYKPSPDSDEMQYLHEHRQKLGGPVPQRRVQLAPLAPPPDKLFSEFDGGSEGRELSTTMAYVRMLSRFLKDKNLGPLIVPIIPDEARTFGMEGLFNLYGIYSHAGQKYDPVDSDSLMRYREAQNGQILEEGITEAGSLSSFIAAGTAYASHGVNTIPFFTFYSMFGLQRVGDLVWAAGDMRCKGFLMGATAGRTTLAGEGLQHQDGNSHVLALPHPTLKAYDPAFAYEIGVLLQEGIRRMYVEQKDEFYYITIGNEAYAQPPMPEGVREGILKGLYRFKRSELVQPKARVQLWGSGALMPGVLKAAEMLERYGVAADVWSVTSYKELYQDALDAERWNLLHPEQPERQSWLQAALAETEGPVIAISDYCKVLALSLAKWVPQGLIALGTDGFGRSEGRTDLRRFFEVDAEHTTWTALSHLVRAGKLDASLLKEARSALRIDPEKPNPMSV